MDAIILAGGRGSRMGALTATCNKGALFYQARPLVCHVIDRILPIDTIGRIRVATGYEGATIREPVCSNFADSVHAGRILFLESGHIIGDFKRLAYALEVFDIRSSCIACGIDVIAPFNVLSRFVEFASLAPNADLVVLASPRYEVAPTHTRINVEGRIVKQYVRPDEGMQPIGAGWFASLNICFLSADLVAELRAHPPQDASGLVRSATYVWRKGGIVSAFTFNDQWLHFASEADLVKYAA